MRVCRFTDLLLRQLTVLIPAAASALLKADEQGCTAANATLAPSLSALIHAERGVAVVREWREAVEGGADVDLQLRAAEWEARTG